MADCRSPEDSGPAGLHSRSGEVPSYPTLDGSLIEELMHPDHHGVRHQSLARATVPAGRSTRLHRHHRAEEVYHILSGRGRMWLGETVFAIGPGDSVCIPPGTPHRLAADEDGELVLLCACTPAYAHEDTELLD